jgi:hypothetical protein
MELRSYYRLSRAPRYSVLFALPLLLLYEGLAALLAEPDGGGIRNGADVLLKSFFGAVAGPHAMLVFGVVIIGGSIWFIARDLRRSGGTLRWRVFAAMLGESMLLALLFGAVVGTVTAGLLGQLAAALPVPLAQGPVEQLDGWTQLMVSLGAGLYEELVFRVLLVTALAALGRRLFQWRPPAAGTVATVVGALLFSAFHYVGPFGDPLELTSFTFRFVAGLAFSALYLTRGFGITAWTHALYDVYLLIWVGS